MDDDLDPDLAEIADVDLNEINLHAAIGYFIAAYSKVELAVTTLLAVLTKNEDYEAFHTLTRGMDLRVKIERLRELCKPHSLIDEQSAVDMRLKLVLTKICGLRNKLSHSYIDIPDPIVPELGLSTIMGLRPKSKNANTELWHQNAFGIYTEWCEAFFLDLINLVPNAKKTAKFSIGHPNSDSPMEFHQRLQKQEQSARLDRLRRTRDRKP